MIHRRGDGGTDGGAVSGDAGLHAIDILFEPLMIKRHGTGQVGGAGEGDDPDAVNVSGFLAGSGGDGPLTWTAVSFTSPVGFTPTLVNPGLIEVRQGGTLVFTIAFNTATGAYTVTQVAPIDHVAGLDENNTSFTFGYRVTDADGNVKAVHVVDVEWKKDDKGNFGPQKIAGTEKVLPADLVLLAMGFLGPEQPLLDALNVERDARSNIKAEHEKYTTSLPGVFAAGDCRRGQSLVVWAFNEGRGAARECDRYLMGATDLP